MRRINPVLKMFVVTCCLFISVFAVAGGNLAHPQSVHAASPSSPAALRANSGGTLYAGEDGNSGKKVIALDALNAKVLWHTKIPNPATPVFNNGVLYVPRTLSLYALNASTGAVLWNFVTQYWIYQPPVIVNNIVYLADLSAVYALNASNGHLLWQYTFADIQAPITVANGAVYVNDDGNIGNDDGNIGQVAAYALNASTGAVLWSYALTTPLNVSTVVNNNVAYIAGDDGTVYALNASTGALLWKQSTIQYAYSLTLTNNTLYLVDTGAIYALDPNSGAVLWNFTIGGYYGFIFTEVNGTIYASSNTTLYALNANTGAVLWQQTLGDFSSPAVVSNGVVYIGVWASGPHKITSLYAFNASTGAQLWVFKLHALYRGVNTPVVGNNLVYQSAGYECVALNATTGALVWKVSSTGTLTQLLFVP